MGIQIVARPHGYVIHQEQSSNDLLVKAGMPQTHLVVNPLPSKVVSTTEDHNSFVDIVLLPDHYNT